MGSTPSQKSWTILIVDDEPEIIVSLSDFFTHQNYLAKGFTDPREAFEWGKKNSFDLLISDLKMPGMSGLELHEKLRIYYPELITILITAYYSFDSAQEAIGSNIYAYLNKPFKLQDIANIVQRALEKKELLDRNHVLVEEQQQLIEKLLVANKELKQLSRLKSDFVSNVSHELRTPLTSLKTLLFNLLNGVAGGINEKQKEYAEMMEEDVTRLHRLINDILDLSQLDSGKAQLKLAPVRLNEMIDSALKLFVGEVGRGIEFFKEFHEVVETVEVMVDRDKIEQVLVNLLNNAVKYSGAGKRVWVRVHPAGESVIVLVQDEGIGIPGEDQGKIFDRFEQLEKMARGATQGAGLGLAIVKKILEMHGKNIGVESKPHHGSTFSFELPIYLKKEKFHDT